MGDFNGFDSQGLLELTNLELSHIEPTRSTNMLDEIFTSDCSLIDRELDTVFRLLTGTIWFLLLQFVARSHGIFSGHSGTTGKTKD